MLNTQLPKTITNEYAILEKINSTPKNMIITNKLPLPFPNAILTWSHAKKLTNKINGIKHTHIITKYLYDWVL